MQLNFKSVHLFLITALPPSLSPPLQSKVDRVYLRIFLCRNSIKGDGHVIFALIEYVYMYRVGKRLLQQNSSLTSTSNKEEFTLEHVG